MNGVGINAPPTAAMQTLVDGHVHYHPCFDPVVFLDSAASNFQRNADILGCGNSWIGCLLMADMAGQNSIATLQAEERAGRLGPWRLHRTPEAISAYFRREDGLELAIVEGQQIVTAERIELLALCCRGGIPERRPLRETLVAAQRLHALPVLPWGVGKWWLRRGEVIASLLKNPVETVFLGDNSGRPAWSPESSLFRLARRLGVRILPGSDPLPLPSQVRVAARFGFLLPAQLETQSPAACIQTELVHGDPHRTPRSFGQRVGLGDFVRDQLALRRSTSNVR